MVDRIPAESFGVRHVFVSAAVWRCEKPVSLSASSPVCCTTIYRPVQTMMSLPGCVTWPRRNQSTCQRAWTAANEQWNVFMWTEFKNTNNDSNVKIWCPLEGAHSLRTAVSDIRWCSHVMLDFPWSSVAVCCRVDSLLHCDITVALRGIEAPPPLWDYLLTKFSFVVTNL